MNYCSYEHKGLWHQGKWWRRILEEKEIQDIYALLESGATDYKVSVLFDISLYKANQIREQRKTV